MSRRTGGVAGANYVRHIPTIDGTGKTYCGRVAAKVNCIDLRSDCIEDAECRACQRSDDRRTQEDHRRSERIV